jgi:endoglucanase
VSSAGWCCSIQDGEGLWYTDEYPEEVFFDHWAMLSRRYKANPRVIGADLRNEIRAVPGFRFLIL